MTGVFDDVQIQIYVASFVLGSLGGLASEFKPRARTQATVQTCFGAMITSGIAGLSLTLIGLSLGQSTPAIAPHPLALLGISGLVGLGGTKSLEYVLATGQDLIAALLRAGANRMKHIPDENESEA